MTQFWTATTIIRHTLIISLKIDLYDNKFYFSCPHISIYFPFILYFNYINLLINRDMSSKMWIAGGIGIVGAVLCKNHQYI